MPTAPSSAASTAIASARRRTASATHDAATLSEDHAVPIDPYSADRVEVIRGPATLRYGSQATGGVVSVENERVPSFIPKGGVSGTVYGGLNSVDNGEDGGFKATAGAGGMAIHADGFWRDADDYESPPRHRREQLRRNAEAVRWRVLDRHRRLHWRRPRARR